MVKPVELRQIRYFIEVALTQSFKGAAARLHVSQSSLSRRVANLERSLNAPLLVRHARGVSLTRHGQLFLDRASSVMREIELMQADAAAQLHLPPESSPLDRRERSVACCLRLSPQHFRSHPGLSICVFLKEINTRCWKVSTLEGST